MKTTLIVETKTQAQLDSMLRFLKEVGIKVSEQYTDADSLAISQVSKPSLTEAWQKGKSWPEATHTERSKDATLSEDELSEYEKVAINEGLADIKEGRVLSHDAVMAKAKQKLKGQG